MSNLDVALRLRLINGIKPEAAGVRGDLDAITAAAKRVGGGAGGMNLLGSATGRLGNQLNATASAAGKADANLRRMGAERAGIAALDGSAKALATDLNRVGQAAGQADAKVDRLAGRRPRLGPTGDDVRRMRDFADAAGRAADASGRLAREQGKLRVGVPRGGSGPGGFGGLDLAGGGVARFGLQAAGVAGGAYQVGAALRSAYGSAMSYERAMIEVGKATDAEGRELDAYGERVLKLARDTGKSKEELASMLASAGFAGRPKQELMDFTEYAAKATSAWKTNAEETGQALAEIGNIYQAPQKRIEEIGDAINAMADNSASRESDLLEFIRQAGADGRVSGIAAEQMLAFGAAMKEVGVRNEVAGTAMKSLLNVMKLGEEFSKSAAEGLKELGINSTEMRKAFVAKPVETMVGLLEKLNNVADPLKKAEIMTNLFGKEYQDDITKLLNTLPKINANLDLMGDKARIAKSSVRVQFAKNLDSDVAKIERATQAIDVLYARVGKPIKIQAGAIADQINQAIERIENADSPVQRLIKRFEALQGDPAKAPERPSGPQPVTDPIARYSTKAIGLFDTDFARAAAANDLALAEQQRVESVAKVARMETEIAGTRERVRARGGDERSADVVVRNQQSQLRLLRQAAGEAEKAVQAARDAVAKLEPAKPLRMGVDPTAPIQGKPAPINDGKPGLGPGAFLQQYPLASPERRVPLPPARPPGLSSGGRGIGTIDDVLGPDALRPSVDAAIQEAARLKTGLAQDLSGPARESMEGYNTALKSGADQAVATATSAAAQIRSALSFTATPTIAPRLVAPSTPGAAPAAAKGGAAPASGAPKIQSAGLRRGGTTFTGPIHVHGVKDVAGFHRETQRIADRRARESRDAALHDTGVESA